MRLRETEKALSAELRWPLLLVRSGGCRSSLHLSAPERFHYLKLQHAQKRLDWLNGRAALKRLLGELGEDAETTRLKFPHPRISLSHAGDLAVAVGSSTTPTGLGIDYEPLRPFYPGVARWFLNRREKIWLRSQTEPRQSEEILRLWTIKEAAYKSQLLNAELLMSDLSLDDPAATTGEIRLMRSARVIRYTTRRFAGGFMTVALNAG